MIDRCCPMRSNLPHSTVPLTVVLALSDGKTLLSQKKTCQKMDDSIVKETFYFLPVNEIGALNKYKLFELFTLLCLDN